MKLTPELEETLRAAVDRIIPADDFPSASQNGAIEYIYRLIDRDESGAMKYLYETGLAALDNEAQITCSRPFAALSDDNKDAVLAEVELGVVQFQWPLPTDEFFGSLVNHTSEGYYCEPALGGNPNHVSWEMVGYVDRPGKEIS